MTEWLSVLLALGAASAFALATALQHRAATFIASVHATGRMFALLARRIDWWVAFGVSGLGLGLRASALGFGSVAVVQSVLVVGVVLAVVVRAWLDRGAPSPREFVAVGTTAVGVALLATFITLSGSSGRLVTSRAVAAGAVLLLTALAAWGTAQVASGRLPRSRAYLFSIGAGASFGLTGGMLKAVTEVAAAGPAALLSSPVSFLFVAGGVTGAVLTHHAYRLAPLSVSMPTVNVVNVTAAMLFAWLAFGEAPASGAGYAVGEAAALLVVAAGLVLTGQAAAGGGAPGDAAGDGEPGPPGPRAALTQQDGAG